MAADKTKEILEQILAQLYQDQSKKEEVKEGSYLIAPDNQFLGRITDNNLDNESINNIYGPYGSRYSTTSIFNPYSQYGSPYGSYSIHNPYCKARTVPSAGRKKTRVNKDSGAFSYGNSERKLARLKKNTASVPICLT